MKTTIQMLVSAGLIIMLVLLAPSKSFATPATSMDRLSALPYGSVMPPQQGTLGLVALPTGDHFPVVERETAILDNKTTVMEDMVRKLESDLLKLLTLVEGAEHTSLLQSGNSPVVPFRSDAVDDLIAKLQNSNYYIVPFRLDTADVLIDRLTDLEKKVKAIEGLVNELKSLKTKVLGLKDEAVKLIKRIDEYLKDGLKEQIKDLKDAAINELKALKSNFNAFINSVQNNPLNVSAAIGRAIELVQTAQRIPGNLAKELDKIAKSAEDFTKNVSSFLSEAKALKDQFDKIKTQLQELKNQ